MSYKYITFIIAHEDVAEALLRATEKIIGKQTAVYTFSNKEKSLPDIIHDLEEIIIKSQPENAVCFIDLMGGSCWTLANMFQKNHPKIPVISGVNIPMLITYFNNISDLNFNDLIAKTVHDSCRGIQCKDITK